VDPLRLYTDCLLPPPAGRAADREADGGAPEGRGAVPGLLSDLRRAARDWLSPSRRASPRAGRRG